MSEDLTIRLANAGKMYKIFGSKQAHLLDALGLARFLPGRGRSRYQEFWALRGIDLDLRQGHRIGLIGRNGAGKTTLLKLVTGNLSPTEGTIHVRGRIQSLLEAGGGLHPEFTGRENIRAALTYQGLTPKQIRGAEDEIAEFTELGDFIDQPFKAYSLGMQARLAFTIATAVEPEILIIDEMLGAGDAYFFGKSTSRMQKLVDSGASVLIVSHALDQIVRFCDETIWLDRGQVVERGQTLAVVKAYERFIRMLEDRRLRGKNLKVSTNRFTGLQSDGYADSVILRTTVRGEPGAFCEVSQADLHRGEELEDRILVGSPQDADSGQSSMVLLDDVGWGPPLQADGRFYRRVEVPASLETAPSAGHSHAFGAVKIFCWAFEDDKEHTAGLLYRTSSEAELFLEVVHNGALVRSVNLPKSEDWARFEIDFRVAGERAGEGHEEVALLSPVPTHENDVQQSDEEVVEPAVEVAEPAPEVAPESVTRRPVEMLGGGQRAAPAIVNLSRWPGEGSLRIETVRLLDDEDRDQTVFPVSTAMQLSVTVRAHRSGSFRLIMASLIFRLDGIVVTRHIGEPVNVEVISGDSVRALLDLGPLKLGNGNYVLSIGLYRKLDSDDIELPEIYDYVDRSYEFQVVGNPRLHNELFHHPGKWRIEKLMSAAVAPARGRRE